jgi:glutaredoxin
MTEPHRSEQAFATGSTIDIVLVTSQRCHFCEDAKALLADLADEYPLSVREVDMPTDEGVEVMQRHHAPFPPVLLVDGEYFGHGRISRRKLTKALDGVVRDRASR